MYMPANRLMRSRTDRVIAGVAGGIARYLAVDSVLVRLIFVALGFTGVGLLLYPLLWLLMPLENGGAAGPVDPYSQPASPPDTVERRNRILGLVLVGVGAFILLSMIPGFGKIVLPILLIVAGFLLLRRR